MSRRVDARRFSALSRAAFGAAMGLVLIGSALAPSYAAGAFAIGKCGAYGKAIDYAGVTEAKAAARKNCSGDCTTVTMKRACAALSVDMTNPCGAQGYAVEAPISPSLNPAVPKCYEFRYCPVQLVLN